MTEDITSMKEELNALSRELEKLKQEETNGINVFTAVGMSTQEVKHSAFMTWLFGQKNGHGLGNAFLSKFLFRLFSHSNCDKPEPKLIPNRKILAEGENGIRSIEELADFIDDKNAETKAEKVVHNKEQRMDIYISSEKTKTVLVIENKVFTGTHDEQLKRYEEELADRKDWRKIFVYLTPFGDHPYEWIEEEQTIKYNDHWCVYSYATILDIVAEILKTLPNDKKHARLKYLMEDYIEMVNTEILHTNDEIRSMCKKIRREHKDALALLLAYTDNAKEVVAYSKTWLSERLGGFFAVTETDYRCDFYTPAMQRFFEDENIQIDKNRYKALCRVSGVNDDISAVIFLEKDTKSDWSEKQQAIALALGNAVPATGKYCTLFNFPLLRFTERQFSLEEINEKLNERLSVFLEEIQKLEKRIAV